MRRGSVYGQKGKLVNKESYNLLSAPPCPGQSFVNDDDEFPALSSGIKMRYQVQQKHVDSVNSSMERSFSYSEKLKAPISNCEQLFVQTHKQTDNCRRMYHYDHFINDGSQQRNISQISSKKYHSSTVRSQFLENSNEQDVCHQHDTCAAKEKSNLKNNSDTVCKKGIPIFKKSACAYNASYRKGFNNAVLTEAKANITAFDNKSNQCSKANYKKGFKEETVSDVKLDSNTSRCIKGSEIIERKNLFVSKTEVNYSNHNKGIKNVSLGTDTEVKTKKKRNRKSKVKRQAALFSGKILVLTPEAHSHIVNQSSESNFRERLNIVTDISSIEEYPELGLASTQKTKDNSWKIKSKLESKKLNRVKLGIETEFCKTAKVIIQDEEMQGLKQSNTEEVEKKSEPSHSINPVNKLKKGGVHYPHNVLDSSSPAVKRGKERENPKPKKPSQLKKIILIDRQLRKEQYLQLQMEGQESELQQEINIQSENQCDEKESKSADKLLQLEDAKQLLCSPQCDDNSSGDKLGILECTSEILVSLDQTMQGKYFQINGNQNMYQSQKGFYTKSETFERNHELESNGNFKNAQSAKITRFLSEEDNTENNQCEYQESKVTNALAKTEESADSVFINNYISFKLVENEPKNILVKDFCNPDMSYFEISELNNSNADPCVQISAKDFVNASISVAENRQASAYSEKEKMKAVKIVIHTRSFRPYCTHLKSKDIDDSVLALLDDLARFQDRMHQKDPVKARMKRRLVYGIKEVMKHLKLKKVKCILIAVNIENVETEGGLNDALESLVSSASDYHVPCIYALSRRALGKVCHKPVPISCVGVFNYEGSETNFKKMLVLQNQSSKDYIELQQSLMEKLDDDTIEKLLKAYKQSPETIQSIRDDVLGNLFMLSEAHKRSLSC